MGEDRSLESDAARGWHARLAWSSDDGSALLQARLGVYGGVTFAVLLTAVVAVVIAEWHYDMPAHWLERPAGQAHLATTAALGCSVLVLRKRRLSQPTLRAIDFGITLLIGLQTAHATLLEVPRAALGLSATVQQAAAWTPSLSQALKGALIIAHLLLLRAALVPSRAGRSAWLGLLAALPCCAASVIAYSRTAMPPGSNTVALVSVAVYSVFSIALSAACSSVIYGLRKKADAALRLGQYVLEDKVGQSGLGVVYRARHVLLRRPTAIKVLRSEHVGEAALARFEREVQLTAGLSHPNIVSVYDFGRADDGTFYYVMEYLDGIDLQALVDATGPQPAGRVLMILRQACEALAEAHAVSLIHRDIKPANLILTRRASEADVLKLIDFGLVQEIAGASLVEPSRAQELRGTPLYMSPESILAPETIGPASDLYALGAVGYFLLTGAPVFDGNTAFSVLGQHAHVSPTPLCERQTGVSPRLGAVIMRCLDKLPEQRYLDAHALRFALESCDDVPRWTQAHALAWWQERKSRPDALRCVASARSVLTVDLRTRVAGS